MALSKGKPRDRRGEKRRIPERGIRPRVGQTRRKRANTPRRRQPYDSVNLPQLVYELLTIDKYNQDASARFREGFRTPRYRLQRHYRRQRFPYEMIDRRDSPESIGVPEYAMESRPTSTESLSEPVDAANSSAPTSSANSSVSNISMEPIALAKSLNSARALFRRRSLVQLINNYIKAGIEEGLTYVRLTGTLNPERMLRTSTSQVNVHRVKWLVRCICIGGAISTHRFTHTRKRRAKKYILKALSFGVRSGYLIPADPQGNVLRVCSTLDAGSYTGYSSRKSDAESRRKRRIARRGCETQLTTIDDRKAMRRGIRRDSKDDDANGIIEQTTTRKRQKGRPEQSPNRSVSTRGSSPRGSPQRSTLRPKNKPKPDTTGKKRRINDTVRNKRQQQRQKRSDRREVPTKRPTRRRRTDLSPARAGDGHEEPVEESYQEANSRDRDQYRSNEDNYRAVAERRKSTSSHENGSRVEKGMSETNNREDNRDEIPERRDINNDDDDDDDDGKSEEASIERDASDTIREMNA